MFIRLDTVCESDGRTDRQTDRHRRTVSTALTLASRGNNTNSSRLLPTVIAHFVHPFRNFTREIFAKKLIIRICVSYRCIIDFACQINWHTIDEESIYVRSIIFGEEEEEGHNVRRHLCREFICYAALLRRRGPHIASHSVCLSVCPSVCPSVPFAEVVLLFLFLFTFFTVEPSYERTSKIEKLLFSLMGQRHYMYFSARTEGRISYGHLGRTNMFCFLCYICNELFMI